MTVINLSTRIRFVNDDGTLTQEAYRSLTEIINRTGGVLGSSGGDTFISNDYSSVEAQQNPGSDISAYVLGSNDAPALSEMPTQAASVDRMGEMLAQPASADSMADMVMQSASIPDPPSFRAYQSTGQAIAAGVFTKVLYQTESYDIGGNFDSSRFTAKEPGTYFFSATCISAVQADGQDTTFSFYLNGSEHLRVHQSAVGAAVNQQTQGNVIVRMVPTDYIETFIRYGVAEDTLAGSTLTYFAGHKIG